MREPMVPAFRRTLGELLKKPQKIFKACVGLSYGTSILSVASGEARRSTKREKKEERAVKQRTMLCPKAKLNGIQCNK